MPIKICNLFTISSSWDEMRNCFIFFIFLLVASCSPKKAKTNAKLEFITGFSSLLGNLSAGGALVHGLNQETGEAFTIFPNNNGEEISISNSTWSFHAFIWSGPNKLEGTLRCGKTVTELNGGEVTINLTVNEASCNDSSLLDTTALSAGQPFPVRFANCDTLGSITSGADDCSSNLGSFGSYQVTLLSAGAGESLYSPLTSSCVDESGLLSGLTNSTIKIPFASFKKGLFNLEVTAFSNAGCTGTSTLFSSNQGLQNLSQNAKSFYDASFSTVYLRTSTFNPTAGALPYLGPIIKRSFTSSSYKTTINIEAREKNKEIGSSTSYKLKLTGKSYPEKAQQKVSTNYKLILGN